MNDNIRMSIDCLNCFYNEPLPKTEAEWEIEVNSLLELPDVKLMAIKRLRAAFGYELIECKKRYEDIIIKNE